MLVYTGVPWCLVMSAAEGLHWGPDVPLLQLQPLVPMPFLPSPCALQDDLLLMQEASAMQRQVAAVC